MSLASARWFRVTAAVVATGLVVLGSTSAASATESESERHTPVVTIDVTAAGFDLPSTVRAGIVTFKITGRDADSHTVQGIRLKPGGNLDQTLQDFNDALLGDPPLRAAAMTRLGTEMVAIGGAVTTPNRPITVTVAVEPGTYYFFDLNDFGTIPPRVHTMRAVGRFHLSKLPRVDAVIGTSMENGEPRFISGRNFSANGTFLYINNGDEFHEVVFRPTTGGITDQYITDFYDAVLSGGPRPPSPWTDVQHGLQAISPGRWAIFQIDLPPGEYAEICYVPDDELGIPHAYEGMHVVVNLH